MLHLCFEFSGLSSQSLRDSHLFAICFVFAVKPLQYVLQYKDITVGFLINFGEPYGERQ